MAKSSRHLFPFFVTLGLLYMVIGSQSCVKIQKHPLVYKTVILGMKPLNSKLNRWAASDALDGCNFPRLVGLKSRELLYPEEVLHIKG